MVTRWQWIRSGAGVDDGRCLTLAGIPWSGILFLGMGSLMYRVAKVESI
jgi:hypothetical protein